ncbi:polysaccharide pyruvyl transferase CsaB [Candidatus Bipolaricaulota bacterium]|nr:polysaccharide pyruvyl transferase CsaB [Candidatus Bipolaricaulota bacterium]
MESSKRITISGYYGFGNLGDEAILESLVTSLRDRFGKGEPVIVVLSNEPERTEKDHGVRATNRWNPVAVFRTLKNSEVLISGGGGLLQDRTSSPSLWYYLTLLYLARILSVPAYVVGQGIGPVNKKYNELLLRGAIAGIKGFHVRDDRSAELLRSFGVGDDKLIVGGDLAFLLSGTGTDRNEYLNYPDREIVGAALRSDVEGRSDVLRAVSSGLDMLSEKFDVNVVLFSTNSLSDADLNTDLQDSTEVPCKIIDVDHLSPAQLVEMMGDLELVIAGRLHALIFSLLSKTPVQSISYDPKMDLLIEELNDPDANPGLSIWQPDDLINATKYLSDLESIYRQRTELREKVTRARDEIVQKTEEKMDPALDWIEEELAGERRTG